MKVVLLKNLPGVGTRGEIVTVRAGHARNYLIPERIAALATASTQARIEDERRKNDSARAQTDTQRKQLAMRLQHARVTVESKANEAGRLYGAVHERAIAEALRRQGFPVEESMVSISKPIDEIGNHGVQIKLDSRHRAECTVSVIRAAHG